LDLTPFLKPHAAQPKACPSAAGPAGPLGGAHGGAACGADAPAEEDDEAAAVDTRDNVYLLHSVLVHSGDVHGGHYYSYVKPQKGFAKAAAVAQAAADGGGGGGGGGNGGGFVAAPRAVGSEKGQYFRFDDDEVLGLPASGLSPRA